jgi:hypothetical protein
VKKDPCSSILQLITAQDVYCKRSNIALTASRWMGDNPPGSDDERIAACMEDLTINQRESYVVREARQEGDSWVVEREV